ncbi:hypothetical protein MPC1_3800003 [Methylocella tundrae]|nr:hypothetical protein MPC1_3800003 [Methylocella tundrae]
MGLAGQELIELAVVVQLIEIVATADMPVAEEDLRDAGAAGALRQFSAKLPVIIDRDFSEFEILFLQQRLGPVAIGTCRRGVDRDLRHGLILVHGII